MHFDTSSEVAGREVLNLGCGRKRVEGAVNLDVTPETKPDVLHDLNCRPWPFADGQFREVLANDVIEHLDDVIGTFEEIHRVCRDGASVKVAVPHFSSGNAFTDPTHKHFFSYFTTDYLTEGGEFSFYTRARFRVRHRQIIFWPTLLNKIVWRLANRYPMWYELRWAWIFPALFLSFELEVVKGREGNDDGDAR
ncbi:MAG: class I SAM-dependent methyltransferase [Acidobacteria bacterium]|nr:class I SAM-dependent methyltransferase [Acidobacteriota bacterium]